MVISGPWGSQEPGKFIPEGGGQLREVLTPGPPSSMERQPCRGPWNSQHLTGPSTCPKDWPRGRWQCFYSYCDLPRHQSLKVIVESARAQHSPAVVTLDKPPNLSELELSPPPNPLHRLLKD